MDAGDKLCTNISANKYRWVSDYGMSYGTTASGTASVAEDCAEVPYHYPGCARGDSCEANWDSTWSQAGCSRNSWSCNGDIVKSGVGVQPTTAHDGANFRLEGEQGTFTYSIKNNGPTRSKSIHYRQYVYRVSRDSGDGSDNRKLLYGTSRYTISSLTPDKRKRGISLRQNYRYTQDGSISTNGGQTNSSLKIAATPGANHFIGEVGDQIC